MNSRSRELANDLARRAIEAAKRRQAESGLPADEIAERLSTAADEDGRLSIDEAVEALSGQGGRRPWNPFIEHNARRAEKQRRDRERLFGPEPEPEDPPSKPPGSADGGEGEPEQSEFDTTLDGQRFQVFSDRELFGEPKPDDPKGT